MRVLVYPDILHGGQVHSLSVDKTNSKLVTSGKDGTILIWNVQELIGLNTVDKSEMKSSIDKVDYMMKFTYHSVLVNNVKWSPLNPNLFISGDVDGNVYINDLQAEYKKLYPFNDSPHKSGVVDISWSSDGRLISWSSMDGKLHVYDLIKQTYQELTGLLHLEKPVIQRSISFDPSNRYLLVLGDDTMIYIYEYQYENTTNNYQFKVLTKITRLINQSNINLHYNRISWSPDGEFVSIPTSKKNQTTLITILSKSKEWANSFNLVGHGTTCEVVKYSPLIFNNINDQITSDTTGADNGNPDNNGNIVSESKNDTNNNNKKFQNGKSSQDKPSQVNHIKGSHVSYSNVIATAGSDKTLALWNTSKDTPILVLKSLVAESIVDICWDQSGNSLFLASLDGHICIVTFNEKEIGNPYEPQQAEDVIKRSLESSGKKLLFNTKADQGSNNSKLKNGTVEILDGKDAISIYKTDLPCKSDEENQKSKIPNNGSSTMKTTLVKNSKAANFTPEIISAPELSDTNTERDILSSAMDSHSRGKSSGVVESAFLNGSASTKSPAKNSNTTPSAPAVNVLLIDKQKTSVKNGKRRIRPMLVQGNNSDVHSNNLNDSSGHDQFSPASNLLAKSSGSKVMMELDKPSYNVSDNLYKQVKRHLPNDENPNKKAKRELEPTKFIGSIVVNPNTTFAKTRLATPKVRLNFLLISTIENDESFLLDIRNGSGNDAKPSRITYYKKDKQIWCDFVPRLIQLATEGLGFWAISTNDGQIFTYSHTSGKRILPPIVLGSPLSFLESHGIFLMAVTCIGELYVWNIEAKKLHLNSPLSISTLLDSNTKFEDEGLSKSERITLCSITSLGIPLITLSSGSGYLFNKDLAVWQTITESWWAFGSHYWDSLGDGQNGKSQCSSLFGNSVSDESSIIGLLENKTNEEILKNSRTGRGKFFNKISKNMLMKEGFENLENTISISHLENRLLCCELLGEKKDFHSFFLTYVKRVCELGLKAKVFEICNQLLGPTEDGEYEDDDAKNSAIESWNAKICDLDKHELLKEVILSCSELRDCQRILTHFAKKLGLL